MEQPAIYPISDADIAGATMKHAEAIKFYVIDNGVELLDSKINTVVYDEDQFDDLE